MIAGQYFHEFPLAPEISPKHYLDVVSDQPEDSNLRPAFLAEVSNLVREADKMYASHHYNVYHFLLTLSDVAGGEGLEHGQSSDNGVGEKGFSDQAHQLADADLLSHEFTHSWNGKYRRPVGLYQPDFATPQQGAMLWVYEGMTQYLGNVLAARSGLKSQAEYRDVLAITGAIARLHSGAGVAADGRYGGGGQHSARAESGVEQLASRPGLLLRRRAAVARCRYADSQDDQQPEVAERFRAHFPRQRRQHRAADRALYLRRTRRRPEPGDALRLGDLSA